MDNVDLAEFSFSDDNDENDDEDDDDQDDSSDDEASEDSDVDDSPKNKKNKKEPQQPQHTPKPKKEQPVSNKKQDKTPGSSKKPEKLNKSISQDLTNVRLLIYLPVSSLKFSRIMKIRLFDLLLAKFEVIRFLNNRRKSRIIPLIYLIVLHFYVY